MSNNPEDFEKLQKLLKLKRHEQPPPGYFNGFSTRVITRIERQGEEKYHPLAGVPWLKRFFTLLETNPFVAGIFGVSICGLLISGIAWSQYRTPAEYSAGSNFSMEVADSSTGGSSSTAFAKADSVDSTAPSISPVLATNVPGALFTGLDGISAQPVSFSVGH